MKKVILLLTIVLLIFIIGCSSPSTPNQNSTTQSKSNLDFQVIKGAITTEYGREVWVIYVKGFENKSEVWANIKEFGKETAKTRWEKNGKPTAIAIYFFDDKDSVIPPEKIESYWDNNEQLPHCIARYEILTNGNIISDKYPFFDSLYDSL